MNDSLQGDLDEMLLADPAKVALSLRENQKAESMLDRWVSQCRERTMQDPDRGVSASEHLVRLCDGTVSPRTQARALSALCHALSYAGRMREAIAVSSLAIAAAEFSDDEWVIGEACLTAVQSHNVLGLRDEALELASRAGEVFGRAGDADRSATAIMLSGVVLRMLDRPAEAIERFDAAQANLGPNMSLRAQLASNRAEALLDLGRFDEARAAFESAADGFRAIGQNFGVAVVKGNLADLASRRGELRESLGLFLEASAMFRAASDESEAARLEAEAAELFLAIGEHREPLYRLPKAIEILRTAGMQTELARALAALGVAFARSGDLEASVAMLAESVQSSREHRQPQAVARALSLKGRVLLDAHRLEEAADALRRSLSESPLPPTRARTLLDLALVLSESGDLDGAQSALNEAADIAQRLALADTETIQQAARARLARLAGNPDEARTKVITALGTAEHRWNMFAGDRLRATAQESVRLAADEGVLLALETRDPTLAFEVAERSLASVSGSSGARSREPGSFASLEGDITATLAQIEDARGTGRNPSVIFQLRERLRLLELELASRSLRDESFELAVSHAQAIPELAELQSELPVGVLAIEILRAGRGLARLAISHDSVRLDPLPQAAADESARCTRLLANIDRSLVRLTMGRTVSPDLEGRITHDLDSLGQGLLGGLQCELAVASRLVMVLPPELSRLPLAAVRVDGKPLVSRCTPSLAPSLTWALRNAQAPSLRRTDTLVVGIADDLAPSIEAEARAVAHASFGSTLLLGKNATLKRLRDACPSCARLHLACHGEYSPADPMGSRVRLADGWVSGRAFADLDLRGAEVVLSGCETGTSEAISGEWFGLVRSCMQAGARSVVASHWRLADAAASELFSEMYAGLLGQHASLPVELAKAQSNAAKSAVNPALWGGLFAIGSWT